MAAHGFSSSKFLFLILWIIAVFEVTTAELCRYANLDTYMHDKTCDWGCCQYNYTDPCCPAPISLKVGWFVAVIIVVTLIVLAVCFCYRRVTERTPGSVVGYANSGVVINSTASTNQTSTMPPGVYAPPPSYDEVMAGQNDGVDKLDEAPSYDDVMSGHYNYTYKPDTVQ